MKEPAVRKEKDGIRHDFLLILLAKPQGEEFWMRLERKAPPGVTLGDLLSSALDVDDIVSAVINLYYSFAASPFRLSFRGKPRPLLGKTKSVETTRGVFRNQGICLLF